MALVAAVAKLALFTVMAEMPLVAARNKPRNRKTRK